MPVWPKRFHTFGLSLRTAATEWKLRGDRPGVAAQERTLARLTRRLAEASVWRGAGLESGLSYATFRSRLPLRTYEDLAPAIARMRQGESDVLWPGRCTLFARTAGTSTGDAKCLPLTDALLAHFRQASLEALLYYTVRVRHAGVFQGRHLLYGSPTALVPVTNDDPAPACAGELSGIAALTLPAWVERHLYEPGIAAGRHSDYAARLAAVIARIRTRDLTLIAGLPTWVTLLAQALRENYSTSKRRLTCLEAHWPNLECYVHTGEMIGPHFDELHQLLGPGVGFHEVYVATEGLFAAQDGDSARGLRLVPDAGLFFEFLPLSDFDAGRLEQLGDKAVPLAGVEVGRDYALVVTTPGGLARYLVGDVVRFTSTRPPRLIVIGRTEGRLNAFREGVTERDLTEAIVAVCSRRIWTLVNFHTAPGLASGNLIGQSRGSHEWWIELRPGTVATPTSPQIAADLDAELQRIHEGYRSRRQSGALEAPVVRLIMPGVFEHWLRFHRKWGGQHKLPRCRGDRMIADQLAQVTNFARD
jgi:hypothetical protein